MVSTPPAVTKHHSIDCFTGPTRRAQLYSNSSDNSYSSGDRDSVGKEQYEVHRKQKPFQPIIYLPPKSSSERRHRSAKKRHHRHSDCGMVARSHSTLSDHLRKNEFIVKGTTLDGSVTLYAASPVGSPIPAEQAGPILNRLSSQPRVDVTSQPPSHDPHHSVHQQLPSLEQPVMMNHQQWTTPVITAGQPAVSTGNVSLTTSADLLSDHHQHQSQKLNNSLPVNISLDCSGQHQNHNVNSSSLPLSSNIDQNQSHSNNQSLTSHDIHQDQRSTNNSLYQDMLELMQKRETELTSQVNTITADRHRLQTENTLLQQENDSNRKWFMLLLHYKLVSVLTGEAIPLLQSQVSSLQVENQMLQLTSIYCISMSL